MARGSFQVRRDLANVQEHIARDNDDGGGASAGGAGVRGK